MQDFETVVRPTLEAALDVTTPVYCAQKRVHLCDDQPPSAEEVNHQNKCDYCNLHGVTRHSRPLAEAAPGRPRLVYVSTRNPKSCKSLTFVSFCSYFRMSWTCFSAIATHGGMLCVNPSALSACLSGAGNVNHALTEINAGQQLDDSDVIVVLDCDQRVQPHFLDYTLHYLAAHDDICMVITPQRFTNIVRGADVLNHINSDYWDLILPGLDGLGFISCPGKPLQSLMIKQSFATVLHLAGQQDIQLFPSTLSCMSNAAV